MVSSLWLIGMLAIVADSIGRGGPIRPVWLQWIAVGIVVSLIGMWWRLRIVGRPADWVTAGRLVLVAGATAWAGLDPSSSGGGEIDAIFGLLLVGTLADLVDGMLARRYGPTEQGALLDMESDQIGSVGLTAVACASFGVPVWLWLVPLAHPAWVLVAAFARTGQAVEAKPCDGDNRRGRICGGLSIALLVASCAPFLSEHQRLGCAVAAVLVIAFSYAADLLFLSRRRRSRDSDSQKSMVA